MNYSILGPRVNKLLENRYNLSLDGSDRDHLAFVIENYEAKKDFILRQQGEIKAYTNPEYSKAVLISEAAKILLQEIAPKRRKRNKR